MFRGMGCVEAIDAGQPDYTVRQANRGGKRDSACSDRAGDDGYGCWGTFMRRRRAWKRGSRQNPASPN